MAVDTYYSINFNGEFLDINGNPIPNGDTNAAKFDSITDASFFIEASGSEGTYYIYTIATKTL